MGVALLIIVGWLGPLLVPARGGVEALVLPAVLCPLLLYSPLRNNSILFNVSRIFICHSADSSISLSIRSTFILSSISSSSFPMRLCFSFKVASKEYSFADTSVLKHPSMFRMISSTWFASFVATDLFPRRTWTSLLNCASFSPVSVAIVHHLVQNTFSLMPTKLGANYLNA